MKKILIVFMTVILGFGVVSSVNAQTRNNKPNLINLLDKKATRSADNDANRLEKIKQQAERLINNRLQTLNNLLDAVEKNRKLNEEDKNSLEVMIQANINGLTALKAKIQADTDIETAKADAKKIITDYYIYRMFVPKIRLLIAVNNLESLSEKLSQTAVSLQTAIDNMKNEGKDTTRLEMLLDDINSQLATINTTLASDKAKLESITISNFQGQFAQIHQDLARIRNAFAKIRNDIAQMRTNFRGISKTQAPTATPIQ